MTDPIEFIDTPEEWAILREAVKPGANHTEATPGTVEMLESFVASGLMTSQGGTYRITQPGREYAFGLLKANMGR